MAKKLNNPFQAFFDNQIVGMLEVNAAGQYLQVNNHWGDMVGYSVEELLTTDFQSLTHPDDLPEQLHLDKELEEGKRNSYRMEKRYVCKNGEFFWADLSVTGLYDDNGTLTGMVGLAIDITERKTAEERLRSAEQIQRTLLEASPDTICFKDGGGRWLLANSANRKLFQLEDVDYQGKTDTELAPYSPFYADTFMNCEKTDEDTWDSRGISIGEEIIPTPDSGDKIYEVIKHPLFHSDGSRKALVVLGRDITVRKKAEEQLRHLAAAIEQAGETIVITDTKGIMEYVNPAFTAVTGYTRDEAIGQNPRILNGGELDGSIYDELWATITQGKLWKGRFHNKRKDGSRFVEDVNISPIVSSAGKIVNYVAVKREITEQLLVEDQYRQAQKMEAVGQLAGGVAHDFNNMLAIILGQVEIALMKIPPGDPLEKRLLEIKHAAKRSAELTQQLLGYARKQSRQPQVLNLNDTVATMLKMLKRLIGENLELRWQPEAALPLVNIDPSHLNQILTNLIINARDAIDGSGVIVVQTTQVFLDEKFCYEHSGSHSGEHVLLQVIDNGCGMSQDILTKMFDPFFTTKEVNRGTGLGLSMVFGLVKQNNGYITASSTPDQGSIFSLYFPRTLIDESLSIQADHGTPLSGTETILVVEDEAALLDVTISMLTEAGYNILSAPKPFTAIQLAEKYQGTIHLLLTDIVMPKMNGIELSTCLLKTRPELKILYMSGYPRDHLVQQKDYNHGAQLLPKPFSAHKLTKSIREILDR
ncbi:MAG: PAS domain S-box protein [Desulfuromusa sp.]|nr:PAS domain S-box protein [Desulfuromusa sp.]